jgi:hypothetical protein
VKHYLTVPVEDLLDTAMELCTPSHVESTAEDTAYKDGVLGMLAEALRSMYDADQEGTFLYVIELAMKGRYQQVNDSIIKRMADKAAERNAG